MKGQAPCYEEHLNATPLHFVAEDVSGVMKGGGL